MEGTKHASLVYTTGSLLLWQSETDPLPRNGRERTVRPFVSSARAEEAQGLDPWSDLSLLMCEQLARKIAEEVPERTTLC